MTILQYNEKIRCSGNFRIFYKSINTIRIIYKTEQLAKRKIKELKLQNEKNKWVQYDNFIIKGE